MKINNTKEVFKKYKEIEKFYRECNRGDVFEPTTATRDFGVDFSTIDTKKHCRLMTAFVRNADGMKPELDISFTDEGIRYLIRTNRKIRDEIEKIYKDLDDDKVFDTFKKGQI